jgi:putative chitinase
MQLSVAQLIATGIGPSQAGLFADPLNIAFARFDISTPARVAAFLGQCMVESAMFKHTEEILYYNDPARIFAVFPSHFGSVKEAIPYAMKPAKLGARVYANRLGNGDEASADGFKYRGRGLLQITGREAYADAATGLAHDYLAQPDLVALPPDACLTAAWYWHTNKLNLLADADDVDAITRAVNGRAMLEREQRKQYTKQALAALSE